MTDLQRTLWSDQLNGDIRRGEGLWCQDYWSEELSVSNASKRNDQFYYACKKNLVTNGMGFERGVRYDYETGPGDMSRILVNQHVRLLNWLDITGDELLNMEQRPDELIRRLIETTENRYNENNVSKGKGYWPREGAPSEVIEWWKIEEPWGNFPNCKKYYPQLFFGHWIPVDTYGFNNKIQGDANLLQEARDRDDWPDWADQKDRDILIKLEN